MWSTLQRSLALARPAAPLPLQLARPMHISAVPQHFCARAEARAKERLAKRGLDADALPTVVYGKRRNVSSSQWRLNMMCRQIRGMPVDKAIQHMEFALPKAANTVRQVLTVTRSNAAHNHKVEDPSNMFVLEAYVGKGQHIGGIRFHARGRFGRMSKARSHVFIKLQEGTKPVKAVDPLKQPHLRTKLLIRQLLARPQLIRNSLEG